MSDEKSAGALVPASGQTSLPSAARIGADFSHLAPETQQTLLAEHQRELMRIERKALEATVNVGALKKTLDQLSDTTREVAAQGASTTLSHTHTTENSRTE